uniref:Uncharacterized protein n=1 Tax=Escherichia coli TaxID=562 RepID=A0A2I6SSH0_ECOLX|nr:hypothetical protein [Escherichia coli]AWM63268.1 hypothetical protein [Escherichia coli]AWM63465.1 hypothetical protein [Escherichia coli]
MLIEDAKKPDWQPGQYMRSGRTPGRYDTHTASRDSTWGRLRKRKIKHAKPVAAVAMA